MKLRQIMLAVAGFALAFRLANAVVETVVGTVFYFMFMD